MRPYFLPTLALVATTIIPSTALAAPGTLSLVPTVQHHGTAAKGERTTTFTLENSTRQSFRTTVTPAFLSQARNGGMTVATDPKSLRRARRLLAFESASRTLRAGGNVSTQARLRRPTKQNNFYGALVFAAQPSGKTQVKQQYQLVASVLLRPPAAKTRTKANTESCFAQQNGKRVSYSVPFRNRGNILLPETGTLTVKGNGRRYRLPITPLNIYPGFIVDLAVKGKRGLPAGRYSASAVVRSRGRTWKSKCSFRLVRRDVLEVENAKLKRVEAPEVYRGEDIKLQGSYRNRGTRTFAPRAEVVVRAVDGALQGKLIQRIPVTTSVTAPGKVGTVSGKLPPLGEGAYQAELRLFGRDGRVLDSRQLSLSIQEKPSLWSRIQGWFLTHLRELGIVGGCLLVLLVVLVLYRQQKRQRDLRREQNVLREELARLLAEKSDSSGAPEQS